MILIECQYFRRNEETSSINWIIYESENQQ